MPRPEKIGGDIRIYSTLGWAHGYLDVGSTGVNNQQNIRIGSERGVWSFGAPVNWPVSPLPFNVRHSISNLDCHVPLLDTSYS